MLTMYLEAPTIAELRAKAILVLDLSTLSSAQATEHVQKLKTEIIADAVNDMAPETKPASETSKPDVSFDKPVDSIPGIESTDEAVAEKPKKGRGKAKPKNGEAKPDLNTIADILDAQVADKPTLSLETVRTAFDQYQQKFGVAAAKIDGPILLARVFGPTIARIRDVPEDDQGKLSRIVAAVEGAILTNEFKRDVVQA